LEQQHIFYYYYYYYYLFIYIYQVLTTLPSFSLFSKTLLFPTIRQVSTWNNHGTLEQNSAHLSFPQLLLVLVPFHRFSSANPSFCANLAESTARYPLST